MESDFEGELFETGAETESENEYFMQNRGGRNALASRGFSGRPHSFATRSFAKGTGAFGGERRGSLVAGTRAGAFARSGDGSRGSGGRFGRRFWRRPWAGRSGFGPISTGSEFVSSMQSCLQQVVGAWVPQNGIMGPGTRRAVRIFQMKSGMPVTGLLDESTVSAIQSACSSPAGPEGPPAQAAAPPEPPPDAPAGPEAAGAPAGDGPAGEMEWELEEDAALEQEFNISKPCELHLLQTHGRVELTQPGLFDSLPKQPGLYVIYSEGKPWYVGIAETTLRDRFQERVKVLRDFNLPDSVLAGRHMDWVAIDTARMLDNGNIKNGAPIKKCIVGRRPKGSKARFKESSGFFSVLKVLEQYLIKRAGTANFGNKAPLEDVHFDQTGSFQVNRPGRTPLKFDAKHPI